MITPEILDSITYRIAASIICITCIFYSSMMRQRYRIRSRLFMLLVVITLIDSLTDVVSYFAVQSPLPDILKWIISYMCEIVYYFTHVAMVPVLVFYIIIICGVRYRFTILQRILIRIPLYAMELLLLSNPFTNAFFKITGQFDYGRGWAIYIAYAVSAIYLLIGISLLIRFWYTMNGMKKLAMIYSLVLASVGTFVQMIWPAIKCELLCEAIGLCGIMLMIEKDDDRTDASSGAYNRTAFVQDLRVLLKLKRDFVTVCIRISNHELLRKIYGFGAMDSLYREIGNFFMDDGTETDAYRTNFDCFFAIFTGKTEEEINEIQNKLVDRFDRPWEVDGAAMHLEYTILVAHCPQQLKSVNDVFLLESTGLEGIDKKLLSGDDLNFLLRRIEVEKAIGRGINEKRFSILYGPVYEKQSLMIKIAGADLTLKDSEIGDITYAELMEVAESSGFIEEMQLRTIEEICRFLSSGADKSDMQLEFVMIPIFSASLMKKELLIKIREYLDRFGIDPSLIAFVIKESYAIYARDNLDYLLDGFAELHVRLYISDYQAGFLGLNTLANFNFEGVILDIMSIYEAENDEKADIVLKNRTNMIRQLEKKIIISGVNSSEYYDKIKDIQVDYIQGEFLSHNVSRNELQNKFWHGEHLLIENGSVMRISEDG